MTGPISACGIFAHFLASLPAFALAPTLRALEVERATRDAYIKVRRGLNFDDGAMENRRHGILQCVGQVEWQELPRIEFRPVV